MHRFAAFLILLVGLGVAAEAQDCARPRSGRDIAADHMRSVRERLKPILTVFTHPRCEECGRWLRDFDERTRAGRQLRQWYRIEFIDTTRDPIAANQNQLSTLPTFVTYDDRLNGYWSTSDRIDLFLTRFRPQPAPRAAADDQAGRSDQAVDRLLQQLERWRKEDVDRYAQLTDLARRREQSNATAVAAHMTDELAPVRVELQQITEQLGRRPLTREIIRENHSLAGFGRMLGIAPQLVPWIAGAAGLTIMTGGIGGTAMGVLGILRAMLALRGAFPRRAKTNSRTVPQPGESPLKDVAPLPQVVREEVRFQPIEVDTHAAAYAWAKQEMGRKFPATTTTFEQIDGFLKQYFAAQPKER